MDWTAEEVMSVLDATYKIVAVVAGLLLSIWGKKAAENEDLLRLRRATNGHFAAAVEIGGTASDVLDGVKSEVGRLSKKNLAVVSRIIANKNADAGPSLKGVTRAKAKTMLESAYKATK